MWAGGPAMPSPGEPQAELPWNATPEHVEVVPPDPHADRQSEHPGGDGPRISFGIGTNLTNDLGYEPINIVLKMTECNGQPVAKVSDAPGKTISKDAGYVAYLRQVYGIDPPQKT